MNPEHIELYQKLSQTKIYKERFSEWLIGDRLTFDDLRVRVHCGWTIGGTAVLHDGEKIYRVSDKLLSASVHIPPVFDPERPERCLWGMVGQKGREWLYKYYAYNQWRELDDAGLLRLLNEDRLDVALIKAILRKVERNEMDRTTIR